MLAVQDVQPPGEPEAWAELPPGAVAVAWDAQALLRAGQEAPDGAEARQPGVAAAELQRAAAGELRGAQPEERREARQQVARRDVALQPAAGPLAEPWVHPWARPLARVLPAQRGTTHRRPAREIRALRTAQR